jgi:hypothetical protein
MINNFLKGLGVNDDESIRSRNNSYGIPSATSTTSSASYTITSTYTGGYPNAANYANAAAGAAEIGENLANTIGGWLNRQDGKFGRVGVPQAQGGRNYYTSSDDKVSLIMLLLVCMVMSLLSRLHSDEYH